MTGVELMLIPVCWWKHLKLNYLPKMILITHTFNILKWTRVLRMSLILLAASHRLLKTLNMKNLQLVRICLHRVKSRLLLMMSDCLLRLSMLKRKRMYLNKEANEDSKIFSFRMQTLHLLNMFRSILIVIMTMMCLLLGSKSVTNFQRKRMLNSVLLAVRMY